MCYRYMCGAKPLVLPVCCCLSKQSETRSTHSLLFSILFHLHITHSRCTLYTLHIVHFILHISSYVVHYTHFTLYTTHFILYTTHILHIIHHPTHITHHPPHPTQHSTTPAPSTSNTNNQPPGISEKTPHQNFKANIFGLQ